MASVKIRNFSWTKQYNNLKEGNYITWENINIWYATRLLEGEAVAK